MKVILTIVLFAISVQPLRADSFRGVSLGDSCKSVKSKETALGGKQIIVPETAWLIYFGKYEERASRMHYVCKEGIVFSQSIKVSTKRYRDAIDLFNKLKKELEHSNGKALVDTTNFTRSDKEKLKMNGLYDPELVSAYWKADRIVTSIDVIKENESWAVHISRGLQPEIEIINSNHQIKPTR
jgi:hypothetical protein